MPAISKVDGGVGAPGQEAEGIGEPYGENVIDQRGVHDPAEGRRSVVVVVAGDNHRRVDGEGGGRERGSVKREENIKRTCR